MAGVLCGGTRARGKPRHIYEKIGYNSHVRSHDFTRTLDFSIIFFQRKLVEQDQLQYSHHS